MVIETSVDKPPKKTKGDAAHAVVKAVVGAIPTAGSAASVLMETVFAPPLKRRREKWFEQLADVIEELQAKVAGLTPEMLSKNELFVTVSLEATQIALRNHQEEKLKALRNAVLHSVLPGSPEEQLQLMYLRFIDELAPTHLVVLAVLNNPVNWMEQNHVAYPAWGMGGVSTVIEHCVPALRGRREVCEMVVRDLQARGLVLQGQFLNVTMSGQGMVQSRTTEIGRAFLTHITNE
jgi:hypothetical protein